jgi:hypothetical protein
MVSTDVLPPSSSWQYGCVAAAVRSLIARCVPCEIPADIDPAIITDICADTVIRFGGSVVGPYTFTTTQNGMITIYEIDIMYVKLIRKPR